MMSKRLQPSIRVAPPTELFAFVVFEHQLDALAQGSPASLMLNFALFFLGVAATAWGTLWSAPPADNRTYDTFLIILLVTAIAGVVLLSLWWFTHTSTKVLVAEIKAQMPANPAVQSDPGAGAPGGGP